MPLIEIRGATIFRGATKVFDDLDLTIGQHQGVAILGPNGSGKTTLLKVITRELYPAARAGSSVRILGRDTWNVWELRAHIGVVSHDLQVRYRPTTRGLEVVLSGFLSSIGVHGSLAGRITQRQQRSARRIMDRLGVGPLADTPLARMSTGQQRRCLLARALVHDPDTLILDEPTAGMDLAASFDYLGRIRDLVDEGRNVVIVTHLLNEIPPHVDRVVLLGAGGILADGPKQEVLTEARLGSAYGTRLRIAVVDGYYLAYPADAAGT